MKRGCRYEISVPQTIATCRDDLKKPVTSQRQTRSNGI